MFTSTRPPPLPLPSKPDVGAAIDPIPRAERFRLGHAAVAAAAIAAAVLLLPRWREVFIVVAMLAAVIPFHLLPCVIWARATGWGRCSARDGDLDMPTRPVSRRQLLATAAAAAAGIAARADHRAARAQPAVPLHGAGTRQCVTFQSGGQTCFGMLHAPGSGQIGKRPGVLIMHGLVGSKDQPHRIFVTLAEALSRAGYVSLRFDLRGRGDSDGESIDITPQRDVTDAEAGLAALRQQKDVDANNLVVLGLSWGGVLAAHLAPREGVRRVVLWSSAPVDNDEWEPKLRDFNGRQAADMYGNLIGKEFYDGLRDLTPLAQLKRARRPVLMVYGTRDEAVRQSRFEQLRNELEFGDVPVTASVVQGADHAFMSHEAERQAIEKTVEWLKSAP
jgi:dienelactone hydrolase